MLRSLPGMRGWPAGLNRRGNRSLVLSMGLLVAASWVVLGTVTATPLAAQERRLTLDRERPDGWIGISISVLRGPGGDEGYRGALITAVDPRGPAAKAGVEAGQRILVMNGIGRPDRGFRLSLAVGDTVWLVVTDEGKRREFKLVADPRPNTEDTRDRVFTDLMEEAGALLARESIDSLADAVYMMMDSTVRSFSIRGTVASMTALDSVVAFLDSVVAGRASQYRPDSLSLDSLWTNLASSPEMLASALGSATRMFTTALAAAERDSVGTALGGFGPLTPYVLGRDRIAGAELADVNSSLGSYFGVEYGVLVLASPRGTPARRAGLRVGDVITAVGELPIRSVAALRLRIRGRAGMSAALMVIRKGELVELSLPN